MHYKVWRSITEHTCTLPPLSRPDWRPVMSSVAVYIHMSSMDDRVANKTYTLYIYHTLSAGYSLMSSMDAIYSYSYIYMYPIYTLCIY